jgi:hypothetical protein
VTSAGSPSHTACFSKVRDSLPATLRQHMDAGRIRVDIINITNGSIVVEFNLLMTADLDVREVSAGFLNALQNTSMLEVVRGKTFMQGMQGLGLTLICPSQSQLWLLVRKMCSEPLHGDSQERSEA